MPKSMRAALGSSLRAEEEAVKNRFERAETVLARTDFSPSDTTAAQATQAAHATHAAPTQPGEPAADAKPDESERVKRDSFTMPVVDHDLISTLQNRCMKQAVRATKSEILRAGLAALCAMDDTELANLVETLPKVRTGRRPSNTV